MDLNANLELLVRVQDLAQGGRLGGQREGRSKHSTGSLSSYTQTQLRTAVAAAAELGAAAAAEKEEEVEAERL